MFVRLKAQAVSMHSYANVPNKDGGSNARLHCNFDVHPTYNGDTSTFKQAKFSTIDSSGKKVQHIASAISATLTVAQAENEAHYTQNLRRHCTAGTIYRTECERKYSANC